MSNNNKTVSAFSIYATKRKSKELPQTCNKKKKYLSQASNRKSIKRITTNKQHKDKFSVNVSLKNKIGSITKTGSLRTYKCNSLSASKIKSVKKLSNLNNGIREVLDNVDHVRNIHKELKLKMTKKQKKENKKGYDKSKSTKEILTKNIEEKDDDNSNNLKLYQNKLDATDNNMDVESSDNLNPMSSSRKLFEWLIHPLKMEDFFSQNWEKTPVHIKRNAPDCYKCLMSTPLLDKVLRENHILFTKNIDITSYSKEKEERETHNPLGRALPSVVWDYYLNGCSVRMLNPQTYIPQLYILNATLQEFFGCFVGANSYLTPPCSQGFAPHYDDIEAFILQIEGKKRWRLYMPPTENEYLTRYSSKNFKQSEIGKPILDTVVNAGDLLYLPRGTIHQGTTVDDSHSLHVTLSVYQRNNWCDFLETLLPRALLRAAENDCSFREGLPLDYLRYTGIVHSDSNSKKIFKKKIKHLFAQLINYIDVDNAADLMAKRHIHDFLPPYLTNDERKCSVAEDGEIMTANGTIKNHVEITLETRICLLRSHCIRLIMEDDTCKIYYSTENSKEYHEYELQFLEVDKEFIPGIRKIITSYPNFISVKELPIEYEDHKIQIVRDLWEKGLVITDVPLYSLR